MRHPKPSDFPDPVDFVALDKLRSALDTQVGGDHYKKLGSYQPWEVLKKWLTPEELRGYFKGEAIAYLAREKSKGGDQDIEKAIHVLQGYLTLQRKEESK